MYPYVTRMILSKEEKNQLDAAGTMTVEREKAYTDHFGDVNQETKVYFLSKTSESWKRVGYGTATLSGQSPDGKHVYRITLEKTLPIQ